MAGEKIKIDREIAYIWVLISMMALFILLVVFAFKPSKPVSPAPPFLVQTESLSQKEAKITIEISSGKITPKIFRVKPGQKVQLTMVSLDGKHSIRFKDETLSWVGADFEQPGQSLEITFTAPFQSGEYPFFCSQKGHQKTGEEGIMVVEY